MAYNAQTGALSAKPFSPSQAVPTDGRSYYYDSANYWWRPYQSLSEVLAHLTTEKSRTGHFPIFVCSGTLNADGTFTGGSISEYWFKDGVADADLVLRTLPISARPVDLEISVVASGSNVNQFVVGNPKATFPDFVGQNVRLFADTLIMYRDTSVPYYYSWDAAIAEVTLSTAPTDTSQKFQLQVQ